MDISKIKSNAVYEVELMQKEELKQKALVQYQKNLKSIQFKAQVEALLEHLKMAEHDSSYLRIKFSSRVNNSNQYGLFFVDISDFEKSQEFQAMLEMLKSQGLNWKVQNQHDGGGMYSWNEYVFEINLT